MRETIETLEKELQFQRKQAQEYASGVFKNEVIFARYDQAAKILEYVIGLLKEKVEGDKT